ncbi:MAG TPA: CvpA family protein [Caulobacteraceae bacterium]
MTQFDIIVLLIIAASALVGFIRGGTRELITAFSFIAAILISLLALRVTGPMGRALVDPDWAGIGLAILAVFLLSFIGLRVIGGSIAERLHANAAFGSLDRTVGVGIGLIRALIVLGAFNLLYTAATPAARSPQWIKGAALYPLTSASGKMLMALAPEGQAAAGKIRPAIEKAVREGAGETPDDNGEKLKSVDELVEKSR